MAERNPKRLLAMVRRLRGNPHERSEISRMWRELDTLEAELPTLIERASVERADVERLESPWRRLPLWLSGRLDAEIEREQSEYDAAMADVLRAGNRAQKLRDRLESLTPVVGLSDELARNLLGHIPETRFERLALSELKTVYRRARRSIRLKSLLEVVQCARVFDGQRPGKRQNHQSRKNHARILTHLRTHGLSTAAEQFELDRDLDAVHAVLTGELNQLDVGLAKAFRKALR